MADLLWRVGAFAERFPETAAQIGRALALSSRAMSLLFDTAGTATERDLNGRAYATADGMGCCARDCYSAGPATACAMGCCSKCGPDSDGFEMVYPAQDVAVDNGRAFEAAQRDILADPEVTDVGAALDQAMALMQDGSLRDHYGPRAPARKTPDGQDAPASCPICGAKVCPVCGCTCECCDSAVEVQGVPEEMTQDGGE